MTKYFQEEQFRELIKLAIQLDDDGWHGYSVETVWAEPIDAYTCKIMNSPFFAFGISFEDIVVMSEARGFPEYERVLEHSGNSTYRLVLFVARTNTDLRSLWEKLEVFGCKYEESLTLKYPIWSVNVPKECDIAAVYRIFEEGDTSKLWDFDEGHCGHVAKRWSLSLRSFFPRW